MHRNILLLKPLKPHHGWILSQISLGNVNKLIPTICYNDHVAWSNRFQPGIQGWFNIYKLTDATHHIGKINIIIHIMIQLTLYYNYIIPIIININDVREDFWQTIHINYKN